MDETKNYAAPVLAAIIEQVEHHKQRCIIIQGEIGAGKTRLAERLVTKLRKRGLKVGGIISPRILDGEDTIGYRVLDIETGKEVPFATLNPPGVSIGKFYLSEDAIAFARAAIESAIATDQIVFLDEVGRLELDGKGHADALRMLLRSGAIPVLLVRTKFVEAVVEKFAIADHLSFPA